MVVFHIINVKALINKGHISASFFSWCLQYVPFYEKKIHKEIPANRIQNVYKPQTKSFSQRTPRSFHTIGPNSESPMTVVVLGVVFLVVRHVLGIDSAAQVKRNQREVRETVRKARRKL